MSDSNGVIFVGGPGSGKSNYLFRTWIAIERETGDLVKAGLPDDLSYLHDGAAMLLSGRFAPHTSTDTRHVCAVPVARRMNSAKSTLLVPDANGELWEDLYRKREWPAFWDELLGTPCGFILFVRAGHPDNIPSLDWVTCQRLYGSHISPQPTATPTQVLLVDWLQILRSVAVKHWGEAHTPRLSVVVSAWDCVPLDRQHRGPSDYIDVEFPLLSDYLRSDAHGFDAKVFGLSVLGGDPEADPDYRAEFERADPASLGYVVRDSGQSAERLGDLLMPIYWALGHTT